MKVDLEKALENGEGGRAGELQDVDVRYVHLHIVASRLDLLEKRYGDTRRGAEYILGIAHIERVGEDEAVLIADDDVLTFPDLPGVDVVDGEIGQQPLGIGAREHELGTGDAGVDVACLEPAPALLVPAIAVPCRDGAGPMDIGDEVVGLGLCGDLTEADLIDRFCVHCNLPK